MAHCTVCDRRIDPHGCDGTRCARCAQPCQTCEGDVAYCQHPLRPETGVAPVPLNHIHHLLEGTPL